MATATFYISWYFDMVNEPRTVELLKSSAVAKTVEITALNTDKDGYMTLRVADPEIFRNRLMCKYVYYAFPTTTSDYDTNFDYYYIVLGSRVLSNTVVEFDLEIDPFLTLGIFEGYNVGKDAIISGFATRLTPSATLSRPNLYPEPYAPPQQLRSKVVSSAYGFPNLRTSYKNSLHYVALTLTPDSVISADASVQKYTYDSDGKIIQVATDLPNVEGTYTTTYYPGYTFASTGQNPTFSYSGIGVYCEDGIKTVTGDDEWNTIQQKMLSLGLQDAIIARWEVPAGYINGGDTTGTPASEVKQMVGVSEELEIELPESTETPIYNPKSYYYFAKLKVQSRTSGDFKVFDWTDIMAVDSQDATVSGDYKTAKLRTFVDPSFNGRPYIFSEYYKGIPSTTWGVFPETIVKGSEWVKPIYAVNANQGIDINNFLSAQQVTDLRRHGVQNIASGVADAVGGIIGAVTGDVKHFGENIGDVISGTVKTGIAYDEMQSSIKSAKNVNDIQNSFYTPAVYQAEAIDNLATVIKNNFIVTVYNPASLKDFDEFLTQYGYATCEYFRLTDDINGYVENHGVNFCYIQMSACASVSNDMNCTEQMNRVIERRMNSGIRIWKVAPTRTAYAENNLK